MVENSKICPHIAPITTLTGQRTPMLSKSPSGDHHNVTGRDPAAPEHGEAAVADVCPPLYAHFGVSPSPGRERIRAGALHEAAGEEECKSMKIAKIHSTR